MQNYKTYISTNIRTITKEGIILDDNTLIEFATCAINYKEKHPNSSLNCVGDRNIKEYEYIFYNDDVPTVIKFVKKNWFKELVTKETNKLFNELNNFIIIHGYKTYDLT